MTGQLLHSMYIFSCSEYRLDHKLIDQTDFNNLERYIRERTSPSPIFLQYYSPNAFRDLQKFAENKRAYMWSVDIVAEFWRYHHNHKESPVLSGKVSSISTMFVTVVVSNKVMRVTNQYLLKLKPGDEVFIHQWVVVDKKSN